MDSNHLEAKHITDALSTEAQMSFVCMFKDVMMLFGKLKQQELVVHRGREGIGEMAKAWLWCLWNIMIRSFNLEEATWTNGWAPWKYFVYVAVSEAATRFSVWSGRLGATQVLAAAKK
ncbi:hypothetical protein R1sor_003889 [Riccia sorocarpa]|uniref:Uncharacterized protein n=1 Tax=Riccia sorocarpa TaxID=122646 RepID=A0ABD3H5S8_9MARC